MKRILLVAICFFSLTQIHAQHTISGIITNKKDNSQLIEGVLVYIPEFNKTDISREGGTYILRNIGIGTIHIQFSKNGFKTVAKTIYAIDSATVINVDLEPLPAENDKLLLSANYGALASEVPYSATNISAKELNRKDQINLLGALSSTPGIDRITMGNSIQKPVIRGLSFSRVLSHQFGTRIENQAWNLYQDWGVNESSAGSVELIKGPASVLYGAGAMGGVLVFNDHLPPVAGTVEGDLTLQYFNNTAGFSPQLGIRGASVNGIFYSLEVGAKSHTSYIQGQGEKVRKNTEQEDFAYNSGFNSTNAKATIGLNHKHGQSRINFSYLRRQEELIYSISDSAILLIEENIERERTSNPFYHDASSYIVASENIFLVKKSKLNLNLAMQNSESKIFAPDFNDEVTETTNIKTQTISYDLRYSSDALKKFGYTIGSQGYVQATDNLGRTSNFPNSTISDLAGYVLLRYDLPKINFLAGARYDSRTVNHSPYYGNGEIVSLILIDNEQKFSLISSSAGLVWHPIENLNVRLNLSSGFSTPDLMQLSMPGSHFYGILTDSLVLKEELNYECDLGVRWNHEIISIDISGFYNMISNYIFPLYSSIDSIISNDTLPIFNFSQVDAVISGGELSLHLHPPSIKWIDFKLGYYMTHGEFKDSKKPLSFIPADKIVAAIKFQSERMNYMYRPYISFILNNYFKQDRVYDLENVTESYSTIDLHVGVSFKWTKQMFDLSLSVTNILDEGYVSHLSLVKDLKPVPVRDMGRNVSLHVRIPFGIKRDKALN